MSRKEKLNRGKKNTIIHKLREHLLWAPWDYPKDCCASFHIQTQGKCRFGENCKFPHAKSDMKFGWQLNEADGNTRGSNEDDVDEWGEEERDIPKTCYLCRQILGDAVKTKCGHVCCEDCFSSEIRDTCLMCFRELKGIVKHIKVRNTSAALKVM